MKLLICDNMDEYHILAKRVGKYLSESEFVIGTVQGKFLLQCSKEHPEWICKLMEYNGVNKSSLIISQLKEINHVMGEDINKKYLFEVDYSVEGSGVAQEIANLVYSTEMCVAFYERYMFDEIFIFCNKNNYLQTEIFREIAAQKHVKLKIVYKNVLSIENIKDRIFISSGRGNKRLKYIFYYFKMFQNFIGLFFSFLICRKFKNKAVKYYDVGRICFTDAIKHYNWNINKIKEYRKKLNLNIICAGTEPGTKKRYINDGFNASQFEESYLELRYIFSELRLYFYWLRKLTKRVRKLQMTYAQLDISNMVYHRMKQHFLLSVPKAIIIDCMAKGFFEKNKYKMIEGCMGGNSIYTRVFYYNTRDNNSIFFRELNYDTYPLEPIYGEEVESNIIALRFFCGHYGGKICDSYIKNGWNGEAVLLESAVGKVKAERKQKPEKQISILWAPSYPLIGYCSYDAWYEQNEAIIEGLSRIEGINLIVKYHINQDDYSINTFKEKYENCRVLFVDKKDAIEKYIREADIVVTNPSTVIYDAMLMNRITIAIMSGSQVALKEKLDFITCMDAKETIEYIVKLIKEKQSWIERLDKQSAYVNKFLDFETDDVDTMITQTLCRKIGDRILQCRE